MHSCHTPVAERRCPDVPRTPRSRENLLERAGELARGAQMCSADSDRLMPRAPVGVEITGSPAAMKSNILMLVPDPENIGLTATSAAPR